MEASAQTFKETLQYYSKSVFENKIVSVFIPLIIIIYTITSYYWLVIKYNVNVPCSDDYGIALQFLNDFTEEDSPLDKFNLLFKQHVDHRVVFPRLIVLFDFLFEGKVNFLTLVVIGNIGLVWIAIVLFITFAKQKGNILLFSPVILLLFQLQHWENAGFPTASIQSFYVIFFVFASIYSLSIDTKWGLALACLTFFLAIFTSGNGMFSLLPGAFILINKKKYKALGVWIFVFLGSVSFYFYQYSHQNQKIIGLFLEKPLELITTFFVAIGGFINFSKAWEPIGVGYSLSIAFGVVVTLFFLYLTFSKYFLQSPVLYGFLFFLLITCAALAVSRVSLYSPNELSTVSRYKIVSLSCISVSYLIFIDVWKTMGLYKALVFIPLGLYYNSVANEKNLSIFKTHTERLMESSWAVYSNSDYSRLVDWNPALSAKILKESQEKRVYTLPDLRDEFLRRVPEAYQLPSVSAELIIPADSTVKYQFEIQSTKDGLSCGVRKGWALAKGKVTKRNIFVLKNSVTSYFFSTSIEYRGDLSEVMRTSDPSDSTNYSDSGFNVCVSLSKLNKGEYEAGVLLETWDRFSYYIPAGKIIVR